MWPRTCCRFSWLTQIRFSPLLVGASPPVNSSQLVNSRPHWLASRWVTFRSSAAASRWARLRRQEVDVGVAGVVAALLHVEGPLEGQRQVALPRLDLQLAAQRPVLEPPHRLDVDLPDRQVDLAGAVDVGVRGAAHLAVAAEVLEPGGVDVGLVAVGGEDRTRLRPAPGPRPSGSRRRPLRPSPPGWPAASRGPRPGLPGRAAVRPGPSRSRRWSGSRRRVRRGRPGAPPPPGRRRSPGPPRRLPPSPPPCAASPSGRGRPPRRTG